MVDSHSDRYEAVIGLEVHVQLQTFSKIFTSDSTEYGSPPNTNVSVITLGHPGTLPRINRKAVEYAIKMGLACGCDITRENIFDRKNYFYPDLPKGYQITQDRTPVCKGGSVLISPKGGNDREIRLNRIHLEEDAGKSIHLPDESDTLVDFNRAGVPLIEIVTEPVIHTPEESHAFLTEIRRLVKYLAICDGDMEKGSLRCDANISIMPRGSDTLGKKVEVKNMNSMRNVQRAIEYEIRRQVKIIESGGEIISETRTFNDATGTTAGMRTKEELNDYRYFPDPDLSPVQVSEEWLRDIQNDMPSLPRELFKKFVNEFALPEYDAGVLIDNREVAGYFESVTRHTDAYKAASNWIMGPVKSYLNEHSMNMDDFILKASKLAELIELVQSGKVSFSLASKRIFPALLERPDASVEGLAREMNLIQRTDTDEIEKLIDEVLDEFPDKVKAYRGGHKGLLGMFMGEVMGRGKGQVNPKMANELLIKKLS